VSLRVDYDGRAISRAAAFLDDSHSIRAVLDAIDRLADDPARRGRADRGGEHQAVLLPQLPRP
jgi:hypothetical protein